MSDVCNPLEEKSLTASQEQQLNNLYPNKSHWFLFQEHVNRVISILKIPIAPNIGYPCDN